MQHYDLQKQQPLFVNRDSQPVAHFEEMANERRVGYAWSGDWAAKLLDQELPRWRAQRAAQAD